MKQLLNDVKAAAQASANLAKVKDRDVYITEDLDLVRNHGDYPAIGIKDGGQVFTVLTGTEIDARMTVKLGCYVDLTAQEAGLMGNSRKPGVLDLAKAVVAMLGDTDWAARYEAVTVTDIGESRVLVTDDRALLLAVVSVIFELCE